MTDPTPSPPDAPVDTDGAVDRTERTADEPAADRGAPITVLQVEPDPRSAELLEAFASRLTDRIRIRSVDRFAAALDAVETGVSVDGEHVAVDCVVTERRLPDGDGVALVDGLRGADRDLPVVFHATCPAEECEAAAVDAGADAYFEKGSDRGTFDAIIDRVRALVEERRERTGDAERSPPNTLGSPGETLPFEE
ncbi:response regulator [Halorubrum trapanicum]|uniref:response regulator n=1 Tax=Halorubrum trapanicum TaxID=29284 RepID=UPI003C70370E